MEESADFWRLLGISAVVMLISNTRSYMQTTRTLWNGVWKCLKTTLRLWMGQHPRLGLNRGKIETHLHLCIQRSVPLLSFFCSKTGWLCWTTQNFQAARLPLQPDRSGSFSAGENVGTHSSHSKPQKKIMLWSREYFKWTCEEYASLSNTKEVDDQGLLRECNFSLLIQSNKKSYRSIIEVGEPLTLRANKFDSLSFSQSILP